MLHPEVPDEAFKEEADAAKNLGIEVAVIDVDALTSEGMTEATRRVPPDRDAVLYRGWMMSSSQYWSMETALREKQTGLVTSSEQYQKSHEMPGWYPYFRSHTPLTGWTDGEDTDELLSIPASLGFEGSAILRDFVKSEKHHWLEACFVPDIADGEALRSVAENLRAFRGANFTGGYVIRDFEEFEGPEIRTWWVNGERVLTTAHPDTPDDFVEPDDIDGLERCVAALGAPFVSVDLVHRRDGVWRVVEIGDGQVSDRPRSVEADRFIGSISTAVRGAGRA